MFDERLQDLEQEQLGYGVGTGDLWDTAQLSIVGGAIHEDAHCIVGLSGKPHSLSFASFAALSARKRDIDPAAASIHSIASSSILTGNITTSQIWLEYGLQFGIIPD